MRLLGEDLVVFRDGSGRLGLLHRHCAHRGASLEFGIPAERGIHCCYHGWHFDVDGTILDTPAEPAGSRIKQSFCQGAYQVRESQGLLFAYMGPPEHTPVFPVYDVYGHPPGNRLANFRMEYPCNWRQVVENAADPIHNAYLHAIVSGLQFSAAFREPPVLDFVQTPLGFLSMATRKVRDFVFVRASGFGRCCKARWRHQRNSGHGRSIRRQSRSAPPRVHRRTQMERFDAPVGRASGICCADP